MKYVLERAFNAEFSSCTTTNSCRQSIKTSDGGVREDGEAIMILQNYESIEFQISIERAGGSRIIYLNGMIESIDSTSTARTADYIV